MGQGRRGFLKAAGLAVCAVAGKRLLPGGGGTVVAQEPGEPAGRVRWAMVVDPAYDIKDILDVVAADDMRLVGALATHYHPDHVGGDMMGYRISGVRELQVLHPVPVHVQADEAPWVQRVTELSATDLVEHVSGDVVRVGEIPIELIHTPGHTPGSQCFFVDGRLVAGDTLFLEGCGRTDLPGGDPVPLARDHGVPPHHLPPRDPPG